MHAMTRAGLLLCLCLGLAACPRPVQPPAPAPGSAAPNDASTGLADTPKIVKPSVKWKGSTMTFTGRYAPDGKPIYLNERGEKFTMEK